MSWSAFSVSTNVGPQDMDQVPRQVYSCRLSTRTTSLLRQAETHIGRRPLGKSCSGKFEMTPFHTYWAATAREGGGEGSVVMSNPRTIKPSDTGIKALDRRLPEGEKKRGKELLTWSMRGPSQEYLDPVYVQGRSNSRASLIYWKI